MNMGIIFIGVFIIFIILSIILVWYFAQNYLDIETSDQFLFRALLKEMEENKKQQKLDLESGRAYILPPRFFIIPPFILGILIIFSAILIFYLNYKFFGYTENLAKTCSTIFGLNSFFVKDLYNTALLVIMAFYILLMLSESILNYFKKSKQSNNIKPFWFSERIVKNQDEEKRSPSAIECYLWISIIASSFFNQTPSIIIDFPNELAQFEISTINQVYNQKCRAREKPFHKLKDTNRN